MNREKGEVICMYSHDTILLNQISATGVEFTGSNSNLGVETHVSHQLTSH